MIKVYEYILIITLFLILYLFFYSPYGIIECSGVRKELYAKKEYLKGLEEKETELKNKVSLLSEEPISGDLLEQEVRRVLGYQRRGEVVIILDRNRGD